MMNAVAGVDPIALSWCLPEIRESLLGAATELDRYLAATPPAGHLKRSASHLHRTQGALQVANVAGVLVLTQEAESLVQRGEREEMVLDAEAVATLKRALSAVAEYLEELLAGTAPPPVVLFACYRDLLLLRRAERIDPADLYFPDLNVPPPADLLLRFATVAHDTDAAPVDAARRSFERGLPGFLRGDDSAGALGTMHAAMAQMLGSSSTGPQQTFFWIALALVEALKDGALPVDLYSKRLVARINIQARRTLETGEAAADRLLTDLLFALALATDVSPAAADVRRHYRLAGTVPVDYEHVRYGLSDPAGSLEAKEAVQALRKSWEKIDGGSQKEHDAFTAAAARLALAVRNRHPGMAELADALAAVSRVPLSTAAPDGPLSLEVATAILFAEDALGAGLREMLARDAPAGRLAARLLEVMRRPDERGGAAPRWLLDISLAASEGSTLAAVVLELKATLRACEQALDPYFRDPSRAPDVAGVRPLLVQSASVLRTLGHLDAAKACAALEEDVTGMVRIGDGTGNLDHQRVTENLSLLGFFADSLLQPVSGDKTFRFDEITREFRLESHAVDTLAFAASSSVTLPVQSPAADVLAADDDHELVEVFLLEAEEVLESIATSLHQVGSVPADVPGLDNEGLSALRRAFHTLKGSSRMVGLTQFGDAAKVLEEVLNQWISESLAVTPALSRLIEAAREHFALWVQRLRQDPSTLLDSRSLIAQCAALSEGDEPPVAKVAPDEKSAQADSADVDSAEVHSADVISAEEKSFEEKSADERSGGKLTGESTIRIGARSIDALLYGVFVEESIDTRQRLSAALSAWAEGRGKVAPEPLMRTLHSLVGSARHVGLLHVCAIAEPAERFLLNHGRTGLALPGEHFAVLRGAIASIDSMLEQFSRGAEPQRDAQAERSLTELALRWSSPEIPAEPVADEIEPVPLLVDELDPELGPIFFEETDDLLPRIDRSLRQWRDHPAGEAAPRGLMRLLHTIKGSARMAGAMSFGEAIHGMESLVEDAVALPQVPAILIDQLLVRYDQAFSVYDRLKQPPELPPLHSPRVHPAVDPAVDPGLQAMPAAESIQAAGVTPAGDAAHQVIRVRADVLDRMVSESGEISVARARLDSEMASIRQSLGELTENVVRLRAQLREIEIQADNQVQAKIANSREEPADFDPLEFDRYTRFHELTKMLAESVNDVATVQQNAMRAVDSATQDLVRHGQVSRSLQQNLMRIRMVQFATVSDRLYRVVRQAGKDSDKRVMLELKGGNAEIDRSVLERMAAPMEHLLRNAVAHGIESRARRVEAGKPEIGEVVVDVRQEGSQVIMTFSDDGAGLDYARIEQRARQRGFLAADRRLTERELAELIFAPGFSTAVEVTTLAGRGVGLDVVRAEVSAMGGRIDIASTPGAGTRFAIHLPVSLAVSQVVLLSVGSATFAVQAALVERILQVRPEVLAAGYRSHRIDCDGAAVPMYFLGSLLELPRSRAVAQRQAPVVVVRTGASLIALHVDRVVPAQEVVIKNVGPQLARLTGIAGATVLGNGDIVLILNPVQLALAGLAQEANPDATAHLAPAEFVDTATVMVVDDSVTVRKVTQRFLVREGYTVLLAKDGVDAMRQLQDVVPDMMLVDIEMPRMDGFDLTRNIRASARLQNIPIVMITSRTADKHRNQALALGVDVFLGKPYPEEELLRHVTALVSQRRQQVVEEDAP